MTGVLRIERDFAIPLTWAPGTWGCTFETHYLLPPIKFDPPQRKSVHLAIFKTGPSNAFPWHSPICHNLHHISMHENQTSAPESTLNPGKWIGQLVAAVILAEGIWGFLASLTTNLLVPLMARVMEIDPQSPLYLGKGEVHVPALFNSFLALCLAGIVFVLLHEWSRRKPTPVRMKMVRVTKKISQPAAVPLSIMAPPEPVAAPTQTTGDSAPSTTDFEGTRFNSSGAAAAAVGADARPGS